MGKTKELIMWELRHMLKQCERCKSRGKETRATRYRKLPAGRYELLCDDCFLEVIGNGNRDIIEYR